jgi:uncharacterized membrane protein YtjA (UPF0391 family)
MLTWAFIFLVLAAVAVVVAFSGYVGALWAYLSLAILVAGLFAWRAAVLRGRRRRDAPT